MLVRNCPGENAELSGTATPAWHKANRKASRWAGAESTRPVPLARTGNITPPGRAIFPSNGPRTHGWSGWRRAMTSPHGMTTNRNHGNHAAPPEIRPTLSHTTNRTELTVAQDAQVTARSGLIAPSPRRAGAV